MITGDRLTGYHYWVGNGTGATSQIPATPQVIDADFREVPASSSPASRALVPITTHRVYPMCLIGQPYDSRVAETLARNATTRRAVEGFKFDPRIASALNSSFVANPAGDETLGALATAWQKNAAAIQAAGVRDARERAAEAAKRQAAAGSAEVAREVAQERLDRLGMLAAVSKPWVREATFPPDQTPNRVPPKATALSAPAKNDDRVRKFFVPSKPQARKLSWWARHFGVTGTAVWK